VLTRVKPAGTRHEDTAAWLREQGVEVCPAVLGDRVTYQDAYARGQGVSEAAPHGKAAAEIKEVYKYVSSLIDLPARSLKS
jgi:chromosome partitioning protein